MFFVDNKDLSPSNTQGRLAVEYNGTAGYFCSYSAVHNSGGPSTLCRLMGFPRGGQKLDAGVAAKLPDPQTFPQSWSGDLRCGLWDHSVHFLFCLSNWQQAATYDRVYNEFGVSGETSLSHCGQNIPAISCFEEDCELLGH